MENKTSRRNFLKKSAAASAAFAIAGAGLSADSYADIIGANDRITVSLIGCGRRVPAYFGAISKKSNNIKVAYVCDVMKSRREKAMSKLVPRIGYKPKCIGNFREILADKNVDAIFNATPDHWHAPGTWMALEAGKNVYVEKPLTHNARECELLVEYQRKYNKVVQMGNQQRSAPESIEIIKEIHKGVIGTPYLATAFYNNRRGRVNNPKPAPVPDGLDWDLFQGPAPRVPYMDIYFDYNWHWFWNWGTAETGNNATHELDIARWALQVEYPKEVIVTAAKNHFVDDGWTMYDTMDATFRFKGNKTIKWDGKSRNNYGTYGPGRGTIIYGTEGTVYVDRGGYKLYDRGGKLKRDSKSRLGEAGTALGGGGGMTTLHVENFFDCIRGKAVKQHSPVDEGAKSTLLCHLANISYRAGRALRCDSKNGHIKNSKKARKFWDRTYEKGYEPKI